MTTSLARVIVPASGDWSPVISSSSVVLPAPFGPTIAKRRPALIISPTSLNRCWAAWLFETPARVTRLMGGGHGTGRGSRTPRAKSVGDEARPCRVEPQTGCHAGQARRIPGLLDGVRIGGRVADGHDCRAGAGGGRRRPPPPLRGVDEEGGFPGA